MAMDSTRLPAGHDNFVKRTPVQPTCCFIPWNSPPDSSGMSVGIPVDAETLRRRRSFVDQVWNAPLAELDRGRISALSRPSALVSSASNPAKETGPRISLLTDIVTGFRRWRDDSSLPPVRPTVLTAIAPAAPEAAKKRVAWLASTAESEASNAVQIVMPPTSAAPPTRHQHQKPKHPWWHEMVAGAGAGAVAAVFVSPLDVVRMRMQVSREARKANDLFGFQMMRKMVRTEGIRSVYRGLNANMIALVPNWTAYFVTYSQFKNAFAPTLLPIMGTTPFNITASLAAGAMTTFVTHPLWLVKARLQVQGVVQAQPELCPKCTALTYCYSSSGCNFDPVIASSREAAAAAAAKASGEHLPQHAHRVGASAAWAARLKAAKPSAHHSHQPHSTRRIKLTPHTTEVINGPVPPPRFATGAHYRGTWDALTTIVRTEGFTALYHGLVPQLLGLVHVGIQYPLYEHLKQMIRERKAATINETLKRVIEESSDGRVSGAHRDLPEVDSIQPTDVELKPFDIVLASTCSKIVACLAAYPHEVLRSRFQTQHHLQSLGAPGHAQTYTSLSHAIRSIYRAEGVAGFYKGISITLIRSVPACIVTFVSYEQALKWFEQYDAASVVPAADRPKTRPPPSKGTTEGTAGNG